MKKLIVLMFILTFTSLSYAAKLEDKVVEHTLKNGMKLLIVERHFSPTVSAWIRFKVGSVDEKSDERGIAHLLEHMLFKGTKTLGTKNYEKEKPLLDKIEVKAQELLFEKSKRQKDLKRITALEKEIKALEKEASQYVVKDEFFEIYSKNGGVGYNAFTGRDGTTYLINLPSNKLELWAAIESDRMKNAVLREFYTERSVVLEERRRTYDNNPVNRLFETFLATAYTTHPYGQPTIGWQSDIENLTKTKAERFFKSYYGPQTAIVAVVGDVDAKKTIALVEKYFGDIKPGKQPDPVVAIEPEQSGEKRVEIIADAEPTLMIGFHKPTAPSKDDYVFDVINMILGQGRTSRLYKDLVIEKQFAMDIGVFNGAPGSRYANMFILFATPQKPHTTKEVEDAILSELEKLKTTLVSEGELAKIVNSLEYDEAVRLSTNSGLAKDLTEYEAVTGSWRYLVTHKSKIKSITPKDIQEVAKKYFNRSNRVVGTLVKKS